MFLLEFLRREGWEINDLSPLSWQFFEILWPLGCFQRFRSFETEFSFKKTQISQFWYHEMFVCSESCLLQKTFLLQKIDRDFVLAIRGLLHVTRNFVLWCDWCVLITCYGIFLKKKSFPSRNHGVVENMCSFSKSYL